MQFLDKRHIIQNLKKTVFNRSLKNINFETDLPKLFVASPENETAAKV